MNNSLTSLDWSRVQAFLAVAETGSLTAAAQRLGQSQPTLGRQIKQIEAQLGVTLFERHPRGLALTEAGNKLIAPARAMQSAHKAFELAAAGQDERLSGTVRLTASTFVAHHIVPPIIAQLRVSHPQVRITLLPSDSAENLLFREADIAVRMFQSTQLDVVTKRIGTIELGIFAAQSYLARRGAPQGLDDFAQHDIVGYDRNELIIQGMRAVGLPADESWFTVKCDNQVTYWELVRAGCGIGLSIAASAARDARIIRLFAETPLPPMPVWLAVPEALQRTPRVRAVWEALEQGLAPYVS